TGRNGLRVGDLEQPDFHERYRALVAKHERLFAIHDHQPEWRSREQEWLKAVEAMRGFNLVDSEHWLHEQLNAG
ncbi:MAG TPA: adenylosuccinate synthase, partial [Flavobacteriales bacterium]|nr:adenylosuccinate synthase [Flavobacteriales bacterium]